jgi:hypothetical protein
MKQLSKQFNKLNQLVGEKFNNAAKHELDEEFKNLETQTELKRYGEDLIFYAMNTYMKTLEKKGESNDKQKRLAVESLGNAMITFGSDLDPSSQYGQVLIKMGEAQERLGFIQQEFVSTVKVSITKKEEHMQELKQYRHLKGKMVNRRLDYDGLLNKLQKSTKENHKLDEQMRTAQDKYEEIVSEMRQVMTNINAREERHIKELIEFLDAQKEYHQKSLDTLNSLGKIILDSSVQGIRRPSKEKGSYKNLGYQTPTRSNSFGIASRSQSLHTIYNQGALLPRTDLTTETDNMTSSVRSDKCKTEKLIKALSGQISAFLQKMNMNYPLKKETWFW